MLDNVKEVWEKIVGTVEGEQFLTFEDREAMGDDEEDDQEDTF